MAGIFSLSRLEMRLPVGGTAPLGAHLLSRLSSLQVQAPRRQRGSILLSSTSRPVAPKRAGAGRARRSSEQQKQQVPTPGSRPAETVREPDEEKRV